jgi:hypothetical protein
MLIIPWLCAIHQAEQQKRRLEDKANETSLQHVRSYLGFLEIFQIIVGRV